MTDPTRRNRYNVSTNGSFMVSVWYPALSQAGRLPGPFLDRRLWYVPNFVSHALPDAPCARDQAPYPVVLYSHGYTSDRGSNSEKGPYLASHGYVVVAADHYDAGGSVFPDGSYRQASSPGLDESGLQDRIRDLSFVLAELERWNNDDPFFAGRLDLTAVGVMGFSFGGVTAVEFGRADSRCKAVCLLDPMPLWTAPQLAQSLIQKPLLQINASDYLDFLLYSRTSSKAIFFQISSSDHGSMGGNDYYAFSSPPGLANAREAARTVNAYALAFFNKYLKNQDNPLLDARSTDFPRVIGWRKH